jgi:hypothetical protein
VLRSHVVHKWKTKGGEMEVADGKRLRNLEDENLLLKKLLKRGLVDAMLTAHVRHPCPAFGLPQGGQ